MLDSNLNRLFLITLQCLLVGNPQVELILEHVGPFLSHPHSIIKYFLECVGVTMRRRNKEKWVHELPREERLILGW